jgi:hypothetical protein
MPADAGKTNARNSLGTDVRECSLPHSVNALTWHRVRESESPLYVAGQRIKIFLALFPSAVHLDTPPGSGSFAFRISRTRGFSRQSNYLELKAHFLKL